MANPYTDPKYQLARLMREQNVPATRTFQLDGPAPSKSAVQLGRAASDMAISNPTLADRLGSIANGTYKAEPKGVVGAFLGNPVTKTALNALGVLAIPGRATIAGVREIADVVDKDESTTFSFGDIVKNVKDPSFGFGKAFKIDTGSKWLDRGIGLVGDIAFDPLTYATFGTGKFAGYTGRLDLAKEVLKNTGDEALANAVQRFGRAAIKDAEVLERVGANRHGIYMLGKRIKVGKMGQGIRIPGTGAIGALGDNVLAKMRVGVMGTKTGKYIQRLTMPAEQLAARQALAQGGLSNKAAATAISVFTAEPLQRRVIGETLQREQQNLLQFLTAEKGMGLDGFKNELHRLIEDDAVFAAASPEMQRSAQAFKDFFSTKEGSVTAAYQEIDPTANPGMIENNYFPRIQSDEALAYRMNPTNPHSSSLNSVFDRDPLDNAANFKARTMKPGDDWFGHKLTVNDLKSTDRLNKLANEGGFVGDFFETDITKVVNKYVSEYSKEMGLLARHKHLVDTGYWKRLEDVEITGELIDKPLIDSFKNEIKSLSDELSDSWKQMSNNMDSMTKVLNDARSSMVKELKAQQEQLAGMRQLGGELEAVDSLLSGAGIEDVLRNNIVKSGDDIVLASTRIGSVAKKLAEMFDGKIVKGVFVPNANAGSVSDLPLVADGLVSHLVNLEKELLTINDDIVEATVNMTGKELEAAEKAAREATKAAYERLKSAQEAMEAAVAFGNIREMSLQDIVDITSTGNSPDSVINFLTILGTGGKVGAKDARQLIEKGFNVKGSLQNYLTNALKDRGSLYHQFTQFSELTKGSVTKMSVDDFYAGLSRAFAGKANANDLRSLALWTLLGDERLYGKAIPDTLIAARTNLMEQLQRIDVAAAFHEESMKALNTGSRRTARSIFHGEIDKAYTQANNYIEDVGQLSQALDELRVAVAANPDAAITRDVFDALISKYPAFDDLSYQLFGDSETQILDLMNSSSVFEVGRESGAGFTGSIKNVYNDEYLTNPSLVVYKQGEGFQPRGINGTVRQSVDEVSSQELFDAIESRIADLNTILDNRGFQIGSGASSKMYSGREIIEKYKGYQAVLDEQSFLRRAYTGAVEERKIIDGYYTLEAERDGLVAAATTPQERKLIADRYESRLKNILAEARAGGFREDFRPEVVDALKKRGYYNIPTSEPNFQRLRKDIRTSVLRELTEKGFFQGAPMRNKGGYIIGQTRTPRRLLGEAMAENRSVLQELAGSGLDKPQWFDGLHTHQEQLLDSLMTYVSLSEMHSRFNAASNLAAIYGGPLTPRAFAEITVGIKNKIFPQIDTKIASISRAQTILAQLDAKVAVEIADKAEGENVAQILKNAINSLPTADRDALLEAVGPEIGWTIDPVDLRRKLNAELKGKNSKSVGYKMTESGDIVLDKNGKPLKAVSERTLAENAFYEKHIRPWFESSFPGQAYSKDAARTELMKSTAAAGGIGRSVRTAFTYNATPSDVKQWFEGLIGSSSVYGRSSSPRMQVQFANKNGSGIREAWNVMGRAEPMLVSKLKHARRTKSRIDSILSFDSDIKMFFEQPGVPQRTSSVYANLLRGHADKLEEEIALKQAANDDIISKRAELTAAQEAEKLSAAEVERIKNAKGVSAQIDKKITEAQKQITELEAKPKRTVGENTKLKRLKEGVASLQEERAKAVALPENVKGVVKSAESKSAKNAKAMVEIDPLREEIDDLTSESDALIAKSKRAKGLTKKETSRLNAVRKRLGKAREEYAAKSKSTTSPLSASEQAVYDIPQAQRYDAIGMYDIVEKHNQMMASPKYAKATMDKEMADAIMGLAGFDMSKLQAGFTPDGVQYAVNKAGERIVFSDSEWSSLFVPSYGSPELLKSSVKEINNSIKSFTDEINSLTIRKNEIEGILRYQIPGAKFEASKNVGAEARRLQARARQLESSRVALESEKRAIESRIISNVEEIKTLQTRVESMKPKTRRAALEKMRQIMKQEFTVTMNDGSTKTMRIFDQDGIARFRSMEHPSLRTHVSTATGGIGANIRNQSEWSGLFLGEGAASQRKNAFMSEWFFSDEYKYLEEVRKLGDSLHVRAWQDAVNDVAKKRSVVSQINAQLKNQIEQSGAYAASITKRRDIIADTAIEAAQAFEDTFGRPAGQLLEPTVPLDAPIKYKQGAIPNVTSGETGNIKASREYLTGSELRAGVDRPDVFDDAMVPTPESARAFADELQASAATERMSGPLFEIGDNQAAKRAVEEFYAAETDLFVRKLPDGKSQIYGRVVDDYNAAKETAAQWKARHPKVVEELQKQWTLKASELESAKAVVEALRQGRSDIITEMRVKYGSVEDFWQEVYQQNNAIRNLQKNINEIDVLIKTLPPKDAISVIKKAGTKGKNIPEAELNRVMTNYRDWLNTSKPVVDAVLKEPNNPVARAFAAAAQADYDLIWLDYAKREAMEKLVLAQSDTWKTVVVEPFAKGWEEAAKKSGLWSDDLTRLGSVREGGTTVGFPGLAGNKEAVDILNSMSRLGKPGTVSDLSRFMSGYTGFFRSYATLSPGFHVRNSISNVFGIFSANGDIKNMFEGFRYWRIMEDTFSKGGTLEDFVAKLPENLRDRGRGAASVMLGLGGGKIDNALEGFFREGSKITDNWAIRGSRSAGHKVEGSARFILAWDSIQKGMSVDLAFNRTKRFLIDYNSKTILDEYMRDIIPFWTWMSRNLPLQIMNRWANPKPYIMYEKFKNNFSQGEEGDVTPQYLQDLGAMNLGGGMYLNPDLPFTRVNQQISELSNPQKLLSYVNPGVRVPLEFMMNRNTFTGREFPNTYQPVSGVNQALLPLLQALGQTETNAAGEPVATSKSMYALQSMLPMLGRSERLFPTTEAGQGKVGNAWLSFIGAPVTSVSPQAQEFELKRRLAELQAMQMKNRNIEGTK